MGASGNLKNRLCQFPIIQTILSAKESHLVSLLRGSRARQHMAAITAGRDLHPAPENCIVVSYYSMGGKKCKGKLDKVIDLNGGFANTIR